MQIVTKRIQTDKNVWTFDVSIQGKQPRILNIYGDITNREALNEAVDKLIDELNLRNLFPKTMSTA